jgi:hypothetical protein
VRLRRLAGDTVGWAFETLGGPPPGLVPGGGDGERRPAGRRRPAVRAIGGRRRRTASVLAGRLAAGGPRPVLVLDGRTSPPPGGPAWSWTT